MNASDGEPRRGFIRTLLGTIPTLLVLAGIGAAGWWGHSHGWKMPAFSSLSGPTAASDDWCPDHSVSESECIECHPELLPRGKARGWCETHGVPECVLCNPELVQLQTVPTVSQTDLVRARASLEFLPRPANLPQCKLHERRIQFVDDAAVTKAGIGITSVRLDKVMELVSGSGEVGFDQTRVAHLSSRAPGSVWKVFKHLGETVTAGEVLALVDAAEVGKAKAEMLQALAMHSLREKTMARIRAAGGAEAPVRIEEGEASVRESQIRLSAARQALVNLGLPFDAADLDKLTAEQLESKLHFLGIPDSLAKTLDPKSTTSNLLPLVAPADGVVVSRDVVAGEVVDPTRILFEVVEPRYLWLTIDLRAEDARRVKTGLPVRFRPDAGGKELLGSLAWISPQADMKTRTVKVRADVVDDTGAYRANSFGAGRIILREETGVVTVPANAVQWEGCCHVVFVRDKNYLKPGFPKVFHVRKVRVGARDEHGVEIAAGLWPGEVIATAGSGLLLNELRRNDLGEGCGCHSPAK